MKRIGSLLALLLICGVAAGLATTEVAAQSGSPKPPIHNPNLLGKANEAVTRISTLAEVTRCLEQGKPAYGVTLNTTNVRSAPSTSACRYGKLPKGTVVEITDYTAIKIAAAAAKPAAEAAPAGPTVGYTEDVQPIFLRSCTACHSAAARIMGLQTTLYDTLMAGSINGAVVIPGDLEGSKLWQYLGSGKMPATGPLPANEVAIVREWIAQGAAETRARPKAVAVAATENGTWFTLANPKLTAVTSDLCKEKPSASAMVVSSDLIAPISCGGPPAAGDAKKAVTTGQAAATSAGESAASAADGAGVKVASVAPVAAANALRSVGAGGGGIQARAFGLPAPAETDAYLIPSGGFCIERRLPDNKRGITAIDFAPDGRMFLAFDSDLAHEVDPLILYDAYHPSRSVGVYDWVNDMDLVEIMRESTRVTGLDYYGGALYLSRSGEIGRIPDGDRYELLAGGFAVASQLFHANNGIVIDNGWVYVSAGGIVDGWVEGPIVGVGEDGAQNIVSGGNGYAARIVRAPLDVLLTQRSISAFSTAARGVRNPYGITADPAGRIWFTDNGATNVPDHISAGDEVDLLDPSTIGAGEGATPYYGFPLALSGPSPDWYTDSVVDLVNSAAPTGITWAYDTIFFGQYGRDPGVFRLGRDSDGRVVAERIVMAWPVLALATAPDGALWVGMGDGALYRMTPGCQ